MTRTSDVLIIGAGAFGAATAHQLATRGARVTVLDRRAVASQTSPRAAGLASTVRGTDLMTVIASRAATMLAEIEADSGQDFGIVRPGSLKLARMLEDVTVLVAEQERATRHGLGAQLIHADDVSTLHPLLEPDGILAALHVPSDLYFEPSQVAIGLVLAAARAGAAFVPEAEVSGIRRDGDRVTGVETNRGTFSAGVVVDAAGAWAGQLAALAGVRIPLVPMRHQLFITQPLAGVLPGLPLLRFIDAGVYVRPCWGGLLLGGYESEPLVIDPDRLPATFDMRDTPLELNVLRTLAEKVTGQLPILRGAGIRAHRGGIPTLTVDGQHVLGPAPGLHGFFVAAGDNVAGLSVSPMIGLLLAEWILDGRPSLDLAPMAVDRFGPEWADDVAVRAAAIRNYVSFYRGTL